MDDRVESTEARTESYARTLGEMIRLETVSGAAGGDRFHAFRELLKSLFPALFGKGEYTEYDDGFTLKWSGSDPAVEPVLFMNHHDVVEANGGWTHPPFSGETADGRLWGRGTLDDKGGLWAMLQAADELVREGFVPRGDVWFLSASTEETSGKGADEISRRFEADGLRFRLCLDEGGFIVHEPIPGADRDFAMIAVGEKGCADLKFTARSHGGHASIPEKDSPLVRLGKFMAEADKQKIFPAQLDPTVCEMLRCFAPWMGRSRRVLENPERHTALLSRLLPSLSPTFGAFLRTTVAFTMAGGSDGRNVIPTEAWVIGNMRYSHHQGQQGSFDAVRELAAKYDIEMEVLDPGNPSRIADLSGEGYALVRSAVEAVFPDAIPVPTLATGASDSRYLDRVCDQCIRFLPFRADDGQLASIHGIDENVSLDGLVPAVDFYRRLMQSV